MCCPTGMSPPTHTLYTVPKPQETLSRAPEVEPTCIILISVLSGNFSWKKDLKCNLFWVARIVFTCTRVIIIEKYLSYKGIILFCVCPKIFLEKNWFIYFLFCAGECNLAVGIMCMTGACVSKNWTSDPLELGYSSCELHGVDAGNWTGSCERANGVLSIWALCPALQDSLPMSRMSLFSIYYFYY